MLEDASIWEGILREEQHLPGHQKSRKKHRRVHHKINDAYPNTIKPDGQKNGEHNGNRLKAKLHHREHKTRQKITDRWNQKTNLVEPTFEQKNKKTATINADAPQRKHHVRRSRDKRSPSLWERLHLSENVLAAKNRISKGYESLMHHVQSGGMKDANEKNNQKHHKKSQNIE